MATVKIRPRRDTAADWASVNPTLGEGEIARETDTGRIKYGDGVTDWNALPYWKAPLVDIPDAVSAVPSLSSGWSNFGAPYAGIRYRRGASRLVTIEGLINGGSNGTLFVLPAGYRPAGTLIFIVMRDSGTARIDVAADGTVSVAGSIASWLSLSGVAFYAVD